MQDFNPHDYFTSDEANAYTEKVRLREENTLRQKEAMANVGRINKQIHEDKIGFEVLHGVALAFFICLAILCLIPALMVIEVVFWLSFPFRAKRSCVNVRGELTDYCIDWGGECSPLGYMPD